MNKHSMSLFAAVVCLIGCGVLVSRADTHYVAHGGQTPATNYTDWTIAASNIQDAINVAGSGETVLVSNGVYQTGGIAGYPAGTVLTNRVAITNAIIVRSANNDPTNTIIKGAGPRGVAAVRCVYMIAGSSLIGFTLTEGYTMANADTASTHDRSGGGVNANGSLNAVISNCVITGNSVGLDGGGTYYGTLYNCALNNNLGDNSGGGANNSILYNCTLTNNYPALGGGASYSTLYNCTLSNNKASWDGGGTYVCILSNCTLSYNAAYNGRAGGTYGGTLYNCTLNNNWVASWSSSGLGGGSYGGTLYNCTLSGNHTDSVSLGYGGGAYAGALYNCTLNNNHSAMYAGGAYASTLYNCILYFNTAASGGSNWYSSDTGISFTNCCTAPSNTGWAAGNITSDPMFITNGSGYGSTYVAGNYRLQPNSQSINAGMNQAWMTNSVDRDGRRRVDLLSGLVDIGAYEFIHKITLFSGH